LGQEIVGMYGDSKKEIGKPITICVGKSLSLIKKKTEAWTFFRHVQAIIVDESHSFATETMGEVSHGIFAHAPYRFYLSATQVYGKENNNVLFNIIGKCVYQLTSDEAVKLKYICNHRFEIYKDVPAAATDAEHKSLVTAKENPLSLRRVAFLQNSSIAHLITLRCLADLKLYKSSLILIDEVGQISILLKAFISLDPSFDVEANIALAHGETNKKRLEELGIPSNNAKGVQTAIDDFNQCKKLILIGTATIHTGTNLYPCHVSYNFIGGGASNKIKTAQGDFDSARNDFLFLTHNKTSCHWTCD